MSQWLAEKGAAILGSRTSRRGFLARTALAGTALAVNPVRYVLKPGTAYAAICGCAGSSCDCASACCDGYTEFCCVVNNGLNSCPPGTFEAGWWRADGSSFCGGGPRYYVDCNVQCGANPCSCRCANGNCGHRRACCNQFRYGNCHTEIACAGPIACRVVTCTPPYQQFPCNQTLLFDNATANHTANCPAPPPPPPPPPVANNIVSLHSRRVLDVAGGSQANGARIIQWGSHGGLNQRWGLFPVGDGSVAIGVLHSGKVLDVAGASTADGAPVLQWDWHGGANQRWILFNQGDGTWAIGNLHSGKALDVAGGSTADGAAVTQWRWHGGANQRWLMY